MAKPLTAKFVELAKPQDNRQEIADGNVPGLYLVIQPSGKKSWAVRYRYDTATRKYTIGSYPQFSLKNARETALTVMRKIGEGEDPALLKRYAKASRLSGEFQCDAILDDYISRHIRKNNRPSTIAEFTRVIEREAKTKWKDRDIRDISRRDILLLLDGIVDRGSPYVANQAHAILRRFFRYCLERGILENSPFANIPKPAKTESRDRVLSEDEIIAFWRACERLGWPFGPIGQLLLLTAQRRDEVGEAQRFEFDLGNRQWSIPATRAKNGNAHAVHLSEPAVAILESLPVVAGSGYMFTTTGRTPVSGWSKAKPKIDKLMAAELGGPPAPWRIHDLRRTAASGMAALNVPPHVVEKILNHRSGTIQGVAAVYNRHEYGTERQHALDLWAQRVQSLVGGAAPNVVAIRN